MGCKEVFASLRFAKHQLTLSGSICCHEVMVSASDCHDVIVSVRFLLSSGQWGSGLVSSGTAHTGGFSAIIRCHQAPGG